MIRVDKPATPPEILTEQGPERVAEHTRQLAAGEELEFDRTIYAHRSVVRALIDAQHRKCCYCERLLDERERDVEHFRPKAAWRQGLEHAPQHPGYYWLTYDWSNLYLSCRPCNQAHKTTLFPLVDPNARVRTPGSVDGERPLLVDPGREDPEAHITFDRAEVGPRDRSERGLATIRIVELARKELNDARRRALRPHEKLVTIARLLHHRTLELQPEDQEEIAQLIADAVHASAPFAGMMRASLRRQLDTEHIPDAGELISYMGGNPI